MKTFKSSEEYFADKDLFLRYIHKAVNPARISQDLDPINDAHANRCYDIIVNTLYRPAHGEDCAGIPRPTPTAKEGE